VEPVGTLAEGRSDAVLERISACLEGCPRRRAEWRGPGPSETQARCGQGVDRLGVGQERRRVARIVGSIGAHLVDAHVVEHNHQEVLGVGRGSSDGQSRQRQTGEENAYLHVMVSLFSELELVPSAYAMAMTTPPGRPRPGEHRCRTPVAEGA